MSGRASADHLRGAARPAPPATSELGRGGLSPAFAPAISSAGNAPPKSDEAKS